MNILFFPRSYSFSEADEFRFLFSCPYILSFLWYLKLFVLLASSWMPFYKTKWDISLLWLLFVRSQLVFFLALSYLPLFYLLSKTVRDNDFFLCKWDFTQFQPIFMLQQMAPSRSFCRRYTAISKLLWVC